MTMKARLMLAAGTVLAGTVLAGAALAGCGAGGGGTATGSRAAGTSGHASGSAAPPAAVTACTASDLRVSVNGSASEGSFGAGTVLDLTNSSGRTCTLAGYPGLRLLDSRHQVLPTVIHRGSTFYISDPGRRLVDLPPGQTAYAPLAWTHADSGALSASYLEVTPPGSATHLTIGFKHLVDGGNLDVTALTRTLSF